jgi:hypothetical protein
VATLKFSSRPKSYAGDVRLQAPVHCKRRRRPAAHQSRDTDSPREAERTRRACGIRTRRSLRIVLGEHLVFKGGTSLSNAYRVIRRFSEDVDPTYDIRQIAPELMGADGEALPKARSEEKRWSNEVRRRLPEWIAPDVDIYVVDGSYNKLLCGLIAKTIDVAVMPVHRANLGDKVTSLWSERIVVALPSGHTASPLPERQRAGEGNRVQIRNPARWAGTGFH